MVALKQFGENITEQEIDAVIHQLQDNSNPDTGLFEGMCTILVLDFIIT